MDKELTEQLLNAGWYPLHNSSIYVELRAENGTLWGNKWVDPPVKLARFPGGWTVSDHQERFTWVRKQGGVIPPHRLSPTPQIAITKWKMTITKS